VPSRSELRDAEKLARAQAYGANTWKRHGQWMRFPWYAGGAAVLAAVWLLSQIDWRPEASRPGWLHAPPTWVLIIGPIVAVIGFLSWRLRDEMTAMPAWIRVKHRVRRWLRRL